MLLLAVALIATPAPQPAARPTCPRTTNYHAWQTGKPLEPRKLTELPPANAYSAVYRRIAGCEVPVVVKYGIGGR